MFISFPVFSEEVFLPAAESPSTFIDTDLHSEDVQLLLAGSWKIDISASTGFGWLSESGFDTSLSYPGFSDGFSFSQSPDILLSLFILDRYFFEASFTDDFDDSTFRLGYRGQEGEVLQSLSAGNMGIGMSDNVRMSDYFYVPGGGPSSYGIHSSLAGPFSSHELLLRFDPEAELSKLYIGSDLLTEVELELSDYIRGRFFKIPGAPSGPVFYTESGKSESSTILHDGRSYGILAAEDYSYSPSDGRLILTERPAGALLAKADGIDWISAEAEDPDCRISTSAGDMLRLYEPGIAGPFEIAASYDLNTALPDDDWRTRVWLTDYSGSQSSRIELPADIDSGSGTVTLASPAYGTYQDRKLLFTIREDSSGYSVDNPVEGTIRIYINGIETSAWSSSGGTITFDTPPGSEDRIEIIYRQNTASGTGGDLLFASANSFSITDGLSADLNAGIRWNLTDSYALPGSETSGYGGIAAGLDWEYSAAGEPGLSINAALSGGVELLTENSAGKLLIAGMSGSGYSLLLNRNTIFPASPSNRLASVTELSLDPDDRGELIYKDYRLSTGFSSYYLQDYDADIDSSMIFAPSGSTTEDLYKAGPYTAAAVKDGRSGEILVMDYSMSGAGSWTGVQIPIAAGSSNPDLSGSTALSFDCRADGDLSNIDIYIETGSIGEDLDGDGLLDAEASEYSRGYLFNDPNCISGTLIGGDNLTGSNGELDSEDINGNGFLDYEKPESAAVFRPAEWTAAPSSDWHTYRFYFTNTGEASAEKLANAEFIRIIAVNTAGGEKEGRIMFDDFVFEGTSFTTSDASASEPDYSEISESLIPSGQQPDSPLSAATVSYGDDNSILGISWDSGDWTVEQYINPVEYGEYETVVFHTYCPSVSASGAEQPVLDFSIIDSAGKGIKAAIPLNTSEDWNTVRIELDSDTGSGSVYINDETQSSASVSCDADAGKLSKIEISAAETLSGLLYIDEVYFDNPVLHTVAGISGSFGISSAKALLAAGEFNIIGPLSFKQSADYKNGTFDSYSKLNTELAGCSLSAEMSWLDIGGVNLVTAGHSLEIPLAGTSLTLTDSFSAESASGGDFSKSDSLDLNTDIFSGRIAGFSAAVDSRQLVQNWSSELQVSAGPFNLGLDYSMLLVSSGFDTAWNNYFQGWAEGARLASEFRTDSLVQRKTEIGFAPSVPLQPAGFNSSVLLSINVDDGGSALNSADISLDFPLLFDTAAGTVKAGFKLSRSADFDSSTESAGFITDISAMFEQLGGRSYLYNSVPFYELFASDLAETVFDDCSTVGIDTAVLDNSAGIYFSRSYSSRLTDLLLPYSVDFSIERNIKKDYEDLEDSLTVDLSWRSAALNLFGAAGVYPFFGFYFSDEFSWSAEALITNPFTSYTEQKYIFSTGLSFFGHNDQILSAEGLYYLPLGIENDDSYVKTDFMFVWNQYPEKAVDIPLFTPEEEAFQLITHEEKLSLDFESSFTTELRHSSSLILPHRLTLSAFTQIGVSWETQEDYKILLAGCSFGISGSIIY